MSLFAPVLIGMAFGWILQRSGLSRYDRIVNLYRLRDFTVLEFLGSALITAMVGIRIIDSTESVGLVPIPPTYVIGNLSGGLIFGVGMALSGFCPGTVAAGAGEGRLDYLVPGLLGLYTGALGYGLLYERIMPVIARRAEVLTLPRVLDAEPWLVVVVLAELLGLTLYLLKRRRARSSSIA